MIVILRKEVENLGRFGDQVKVAEGYARNYLIPKGFAVEASAGNLKQLEAEREAYLKKAAVTKANAEKLKAAIDAVALSFARKAGEDERLFGSVTGHDIEEALKAKGFAVEKKDIRLEEPIKTLGLHTVAIRLTTDVSASVQVTVSKEE